ncbi:LuxR family GAF modulated transcriptional regulator [Nocardioides sp. J9]|uniref:LuxR C-terminal-related transcriptional regulator n=1 Tax=unclassified Nocardioides TaxID=2615069 RepID=UPI0004B1D192|nr:MULTISPECIES: LuxR C-terminal-related transcriptional regulator [unclassified Nocardioides]TWG97755.1 LuxR family GAF modulated transcriptional regulator [Nocardioides sp. J9]
MLDEAQRLLGPDSVPAIDDITDFEAAIAALETGWSAVRTALVGGHLALAPVSGSTVDDLMARTIRSERLVRTAQVRHRESALAQVRETLIELRDIDSVDGLMSAGAEALCRLGFDRALVSRVEQNTWLTEAVHLVDDDPEWAAAILAAGRAHPVPLVHGLPEDEARRRAVPVLVTRVQEREAVRQAVAEASQSRSYVAAPVMPGRRLLGFVHGDRFFRRGDVSEHDAELIGVFSQGFAFALERAILADELAQVRAAVRQVGLGLQGFADGDASPSLLSVPTAPARWSSGTGPLTGAAPRADGVELTRRELEVLELMAQGDTNQRIARRLTISEGTVKSHVKRILRKLGAANRAEAVARWHTAQSRSTAS